MTPVRSILMPGEFWFGSTGLGLATGFRDSGHYVTEVDLRRHFPALDSLASRALFRQLEPLLVRSYRNRMIDMAARDKCDIMIAVKGGYIDTATIRKLQSMGVYCVNFYPDVSFDHPYVTAEDQKAYDLLVSTKTFHLDYLKGQIGLSNVEYVPHGYSPEVHRPREARLSDAACDFDIAFVGSFSAHKAAFLGKVFSANKHRKILLAGNGWQQFAAANAHENLSHVGPIVGDAYARLVERSRINIAIHHGPAGPEGWADSVSTRSFEIPAARGFMLHVDNAEIRTFFEAGKEFVPFSDAAETIKVIDHYLTNPAERLAIAQAGYERCVPAYGLGKRGADIMQHIERRLSGQI